MTISGKSMDSYDINKKLKVARQNGFNFDKINKLTMKFYSYLQYKNIQYYLKLRSPIMHRQSFQSKFT